MYHICGTTDILIFTKYNFSIQSIEFIVILQIFIHSLSIRTIKFVNMFLNLLNGSGNVYVMFTFYVFSNKSGIKNESWANVPSINYLYDYIVRCLKYLPIFIYEGRSIVNINVHKGVFLCVM